MKITITQICPKCQGQGFVDKPPYIAGDQTSWTSSETAHVCDICLGAKVVIHNIDNMPIITKIVFPKASTNTTT